MKISLNWLKSYIDIDIEAEALKDLLTDIGLEAESYEVYESIKGGLKGLVVGEVLTCVKHPDADKLKITTVNVGESTSLQIVCGAPNVAVGQKVIVALVGTTLYPVSGEPFDIKRAKIRGVESVGMICAEDEIGIGSSHEGIIVLADEVKVGTPAAKVYDVVQDIVFEIGLTPNRTDAFSHYGVARDLAAALSFRNKKKISLPSIQSEDFNSGKSDLIKVEVLNKNACPRYAGIVIQDIKVAPSPSWLQERLKAIGMKPINNVVDATNYILHSYGQPLHAFDLSAIKGKAIYIDTATAGTSFKTLDGSPIVLHQEDLMIKNAAEDMCIAGVYGGFSSGVNDQTTAIFLESAYFNPGQIRRTSIRHGLRTDAAQHFEKGIDPIITTDVLKIAARLIIDLAGGVIASDIIDIQSTTFEPFEVQLKTSKVSKLTGADITDQEIREILHLLEITVEQESDDLWTLKVPVYRTDVTRDVDVIEDLLRIYGYNNISIPSRTTAAMNVKKGKDPEQIFRLIANLLCNQGFHEILNNSLIRSKQMNGMIPESEWVKLLSSINNELDILRPCMQISMLDVLQHNINRSQKHLKLFEFGKTYHAIEGGYKEEQHLFLAVTGEKYNTNWITPAQKVDFYYLKGVLQMIFNRLGIKSLTLEEVVLPLYDYALLLKQGNKTMATIGKMPAGILKKWDIKQDVFVADIMWGNVMKAVQKTTLSKIEVPRFPSVRRDLALLLDKSIKFTQVQSIADKYGKKQLRQVELFDVYEGDKIEAGKKSYAVSFIFRDDEKTLNDKDVDAVMTILMEQYQKQLNAIVRGNA